MLILGFLGYCPTKTRSNYRLIKVINGRPHQPQEALQAAIDRAVIGKAYC